MLHPKRVYQTPADPSSSPAAPEPISAAAQTLTSPAPAPSLQCCCPQPVPTTTSHPGSAEDMVAAELVMLRPLRGFIEQIRCEKDLFFFSKERQMLSCAQKHYFSPNVSDHGVEFCPHTPTAEASSRLWLDPKNHPFSWARGLGTTQGGMAGGQKWGTRLDWLTG